jgi:hypothetical protein
MMAKAKQERRVNLISATKCSRTTASTALQQTPCLTLFRPSTETNAFSSAEITFETYLM